MKKIIALLFATVMLVSMIGCSSEGNTSSNTSVNSGVDNSLAKQKLRAAYEDYLEKDRFPYMRLSSDGSALTIKIYTQNDLVKDTRAVASITGFNSQLGLPDSLKELMKVKTSGTEVRTYDEFTVKWSGDYMHFDFEVTYMVN